MTAQLIETCWRVRGRSGCVFTCGIYRVDVAPIEVRVSHTEDGTVSIVFAETRNDVGSARHIARRWRDTLVGSGEFEGAE